MSENRAGGDVVAEWVSGAIRFPLVLERPEEIEGYAHIITSWARLTDAVGLGAEAAPADVVIAVMEAAVSWVEDQRTLERDVDPRGFAESLGLVGPSPAAEELVDGTRAALIGLMKLGHRAATNDAPAATVGDTRAASGAPSDLESEGGRSAAQLEGGADA